jgi:hypothetical protein
VTGRQIDRPHRLSTGETAPARLGCLGMEEKPPTQRREVPRSRSPRAAFSTPDQAASADKAAGGGTPRRPAKAAPPVTFQPPPSETGPEPQPGRHRRTAASTPAESPEAAPPVRRQRAKAAEEPSATPAPTASEPTPARDTSEPTPARDTSEPTPARDTTEPTPAPGKAAAQPRKRATKAAARPAKRATKATAAAPAAEEGELLVPDPPQPARKATPAKRAPRKATAPRATAPPAATDPTPPTVTGEPDAKSEATTTMPIITGATTTTDPTTTDPTATNPTPTEPATDDAGNGAVQLSPSTEPTGPRPPASTAPAEAPAAKDRIEAWAKIVADPGHSPELLALAAVQTIGPRAKEWAARVGDAYPTATSAGKARLAERQFTRFGGLSTLCAAVAGRYAPVALLGITALTHADLVLHIAAAYGLDPTDERRAAELLVLVKVHPSREDAAAALDAAKQPRYSDEDGGITDAAWRLGRMVAAQAGRWTAIRTLNRFFPGTSQLAAALTSRSAAQALAARAERFYSQESQAFGNTV